MFLAVFRPLIAITAFSGAFVQAAPFPGTSSSVLISENLGIYRSDQGFLVGSGSSDWAPKLLEQEGLFNLVQFGPDDDSEASLTVRVDSLKRSQSLSEYTRSWIKDYSHYGFDVLRVKRVTVQGERGVLVDLSHPQHEKMLRQVVFLKDQKAVVLTCKDASTEFAKTLPACNQIVNSFTWSKNLGEAPLKAKAKAPPSKELDTLTE